MPTLSCSLLACLSAAALPQGYAGGGPPVPVQTSDLLFGDSLSLTNGAFAAGAPQSSGGFATGSGRAFAYEEQGDGSYVPVELVAPVGAAAQFGARYGDAIATDTSGSQLMVAIGAPGADITGGAGTATDAGIAYVYTGSAGSFTVTDTLTPFVSNQNEEFGAAIAMRGTTALVGAPASASATSRGSVVPFEQFGGSFVQSQGSLLPDGAAPTNADFGSSIVIDGNLMAVGAPGDGSVNGPNTGTVYIYERTGPGNPWIGLAFPNNKVVGAQVQFGDDFGQSVALFGDLLVVGAPFADDVGCVACASSGAVYVFERQAGAFVQTDQLFPASAALANRFGTSVAISDGRILVGAAGANGGTGEIYVFEGDPGSYVESEALGSNASGLGTGDDLGGAVAANGTQFIAGAPRADEPGLTDLGATYVFEVEAILGTPESLSLSSGGTQTIYVRVGDDFAGNLYLVLFSGSAGGFPFGGVTIPLNVVDPFFSLSLSAPNSPPFFNTFGLLDADGNAEAAFVAPPGSPPALAGLTLQSAVLVLDLLGTPAFASDLLDNSPLTFTP